jgi:hypothetical protein
MDSYCVNKWAWEGTDLFPSEIADLKAENTLDAIQSIKNGYQSKKTSSLPGTFPLQRRGFFPFLRKQCRSNRKLQHRGPGNYLMYRSAQTSKAEFFSSSRRQRRALGIAVEERKSCATVTNRHRIASEHPFFLSISILAQVRPPALTFRCSESYRPLIRIEQATTVRISNSSNFTMPGKREQSGSARATARAPKRTRENAPTTPSRDGSTHEYDRGGSVDDANWDAGEGDALSTGVKIVL